MPRADLVRELVDVSRRNLELDGEFVEVAMRANDQPPGGVQEHRGADRGDDPFQFLIAREVERLQKRITCRPDFIRRERCQTPDRGFVLAAAVQLDDVGIGGRRLGRDRDRFTEQHGDGEKKDSTLRRHHLFNRSRRVCPSEDTVSPR